MHPKVDNPPPNEKVFKTDFNLNPRERQRVSLVSAFFGAANFSVNAAVGNIYHSISSDKHYRLQVSVRAKDTLELLQWFDVWMDDTGRNALWRGCDSSDRHPRRGQSGLFRTPF